jgi:hypothetical protein
VRHPATQVAKARCGARVLERNRNEKPGTCWTPKPMCDDSTTPRRDGSSSGIPQCPQCLRGVGRVQSLGLRLCRCTCRPSQANFVRWYDEPRSSGTTCANRCSITSGLRCISARHGVRDDQSGNRLIHSRRRVGSQVGGVDGALFAPRHRQTGGSSRQDWAKKEGTGESGLGQEIPTPAERSAACSGRFSRWVAGAGDRIRTSTPKP